MPALSIQLDVARGLKRMNATSAQARKAIPRALNRVATTGRAQAARNIVKGASINVGEIKKGIKIQRANGEALNAALIANGRPIALIRFKPSGGGTSHRRLPVTVNIFGKTVTLQHAFIETTAQGHKGVFSRQNPKGGAISKRLPIFEMFGPSVANRFGQPDIKAIVERVIKERFAIEMQQQMEHVVNA
jgi:Prophage minor tail protein Z (GPZ)